MSKRIVLFVIIGILFLVGIGTSVYLVRQNQDVRSHADTGTNTATTTSTIAAGTEITPTTTQTCAVPQSTQNVHINYPHCSGPLPCVADLAKADCTWDTVTGATSYSIQINLLNAANNSSTPVKSDTVTGATTYTFPVTPNNTYECQVSPVNRCGSGTANATSLLCASGNTSGPTGMPVATLVPTVPLPTGLPPLQTIPNTGSAAIPTMIGIGGLLLILGGGILILGL